MKKAALEKDFLKDIVSAIDAAHKRKSNADSSTLMRDYGHALRMFDRTRSEITLDELAERADRDIGGWLLALPLELAASGMTVEAAHLQRVWAGAFERANFLGDRAVILAEAGMQAEAREQIAELDREFPDDVWVQIKIGHALNALGNPGEAEERYRRAQAMATNDYDRDGVLERLVPLLRGQNRTDEARILEGKFSRVAYLCNAMRSQWFLTGDEIDDILAGQEFFQPYLRNALAARARVANVPESPIDATDCQAIFLLADLGDESIIPDLIACLKMSEKDLRLLYGDSLTEHLWIPFAKVGQSHLTAIWDFVTDDTADAFARGTAVDGVAAMHHFHPERRAETVAFLERFVSHSDALPTDHRAGILCRCADLGLMELAGCAEDFATRMEGELSRIQYPMADAQDVRRAFKDGPRPDFIARRPHDAHSINRQWQSWAESRKGEDNDDGSPDPLVKMSIKSEKIGRNEPCPCGSGKKYKHCHGK